jgi:shikimate dehydrogenase
MQNLILIGMPGSGKSTVGRALAQRLNRPFVDADAEITARIGEIPAWFAVHGEDAFRKVEAEVLAELGKQSGLVIATGGGCVTRPENYPALHQNGKILWIRRDPEKLPTDGRPLSQANDLTMMYETRKHMYEAFADHVIDNNDSVTDTVRAIGELI